MKVRLLLAAATVLAPLPALSQATLSSTDAATAFGSRERVIDASLSPDGQKIALVQPGPQQSTVVQVLDLSNGQGKPIYLAKGDPFTVTAGAVIVAADSLHGPQLLYASGIRPWALGRHLNDHYQVTILAEMDEPTQMQSMSWIPRIDEWTFSVTVGPPGPM